MHYFVHLNDTVSSLLTKLHIHSTPSGLKILYIVASIVHLILQIKHIHIYVGWINKLHTGGVF